MILLKKILLGSINLFLVFVAPGQHPDRNKINSLKKLLPQTQGISRINCLNALSEEYWWPPRVYPDSISMWAVQAKTGAINYMDTPGLATAEMHLGVAAIYRKNFLTAEQYLKTALPIFDKLQDTSGQGWCNLWLGQALYSENKFNESLIFFTKALTYLSELDNREGEGKTWAWMSFLYAAKGNYEKSFEYCEKSLFIREKMSDHVCVAASLANMGYLYKSAGDYEDALKYYRQGMQYADSHGINYYAANWNYFDEPIGATYQLMSNPDSALYYLQRAIQIDPANQMTRISFGETLLLKEQYDSALSIFLKPMDHFRKENDEWDLMRILLDAAKTYQAKHNETQALQYVHESFSIAQKADVKPYIVQDYLLLSTIYKDRKQNDSAYFFMQQYNLLNDSVKNQQFLWRLTVYKNQADFQQQVAAVTMLDKENKINKEKLKQAAELKWALIIGLLIMALSGVILYRNLSLKRKNEKLENEKKQSELQSKATELEMQALRSQMNPHFIFNCLSSINRFILKNRTEEASDYLTKFSRLIRMVLNNSKQSFISLDDELETLRLYLEMERLRFKNSFDYSFTYKNSVSVGNIFIPPLLLQPFAENAIWHGLMHLPNEKENKQEKGFLNFDFSAEEKYLLCTITDNGVGREQAELLKSKSAEKQKSMGLKITTERLSLLNTNSDEQTFFTIEDLADENGNATGTRVHLKIFYKEMMEVN